jgi:hypothetical protein
MSHVFAIGYATPDRQDAYATLLAPQRAVMRPKEETADSLFNRATPRTPDRQDAYDKFLAHG